MARPRSATRTDRSASSASWPRRVGIGLGLVAVGGTIVLAGTGALDRGEDLRGSPGPSLAASPSSSPAPSPSALLPVPALQGAATAVTRLREWQVTVSVPAGLTDRRQTRLLLYRGDDVVAERPIGRTAEQTIEGILLRRGENRISASLRGPAGEGPRSAEIIVTRDDAAPQVTVTEPLSGSRINSERVTVAGDTEPGAQLTVDNATTERSTAAAVAGDGSFRAEIGLELGDNELVLQASDAAGNVTSLTLTIVRGEGQDGARLTLSQTDFVVRRLPDSISLRVLVLDADGATVDGAEVVFSLSPPGLPTTTYRTVTARGEASWLDVLIPRDGATAGDGFATARVTLGDGSVVDVVETFTFR